MRVDETKIVLDEGIKRISIVVDTYEGLPPKVVSEEYFELYLRELREHCTELEYSPTHIIFNEDDTLELLFTPIIADELTKVEIYRYASKIEEDINYDPLLDVHIKDDIFSDHNLPLSENEIKNLLKLGMMKNLKEVNSTMDLASLSNPNIEPEMNVYDKYGLQNKLEDDKNEE